MPDFFTVEDSPHVQAVAGTFAHSDPGRVSLHAGSAALPSTTPPAPRAHGECAMEVLFLTRCSSTSARGAIDHKSGMTTAKVSYQVQRVESPLRL